MERRKYLLALGVLGTAGIAGCLDDSNETTNGDESNDEDDGSNGKDHRANEEADESTEEDEAELLEVVDAYFEASVAGDTDAMADVVHSESPLNPERWEEDGWKFEGTESEEVPEYEAEVVAENGSVEDVLELENAAFWFQNTDLEEEIGSQEIALVDVEGEVLEDDLERLVLVTEDGEWQVFFGGPIDDTPDDPEEVFEEPIVDEDDDVVAEIDWEYDKDSEFAEDAEWARVVLTDSPGIEADTVRIESTIADMELEFYRKETDGISTTWAGAEGVLELHPEGDQIVVTAIQDGVEEVVHREHYLPEEDG